jgi:acyl-CoA reductase-like NAD-dependent aldehyde dehydrogenase
MIFPPQAEKVRDHVDDAVRRGGRVLTGGRMRVDGGTYFEPTVLVDVDHDMACMTEETFGPTLPIMRVADADEAIALANDSPYGLAATVFTRDAAKGEAIARRLHAGTVNVNDAWMSYFVFELPMGGEKESGIGARHGAEGIRKYCHKQALMVDRITPRRDLAWFPYTGRSARLVRLALRLLHGRG